MPMQRPTACRESARVIYEPVLPGQHLARRRDEIFRSLFRTARTAALQHGSRAAMRGSAAVAATRRSERDSLACARRARPAPADDAIALHRVLARLRTRLNLGVGAMFSTRATAMTAKMVAVGYAASLPITEERSLFEFETPVPRPGDRDLLVRVQAVSVNPVDVKSRMRKQGTEAEPVILGWDAAGIVEAVGASCSLFKPGDHVYYAGNINRPGTDAPFHLVDERIVGRKPKSLELRASRRPAAHHAHRLGAAVRPDRREARRRRGPALAPGRRRRGRRRLDRHPARAQAHRPLRHRHRLASADARLGAGPRRAARDRPQQAVRARS